MFLNTTIVKSIPEGEGKYIRMFIELNELFGDLTQTHKKESLPSELRRVYEISPECHTIAMAVSMLVPGMALKHGVYVGLKKTSEHGSEFRMVECAHSWNVTPCGMIIDSYPVGVLVGAPVIVVSSGTYQPFGSGLYVERPEITTKLNMYKIWNRATLLADVARHVRGQNQDD